MNGSHTFRFQILRLAAPAEVQIGLFPAGVCVGDELVSQFDRHSREFIEQHELSPRQLAAIGELDRLITRHSGPHNVEFWCSPEPLRVDPRWEEIRGLARAVLRSMEWEYSTPAQDGSTYAFADGRVVLNEDAPETESKPRKTPWWKFW